jgi:hypothetical protein
MFPMVGRWSLTGSREVQVGKILNAEVGEF